MDMLLQIGLSNAVVATGLAVLTGVAHLCRCRPALVHGLCLLVLLKLVTPPLVHIPIELTFPAVDPPAPIVEREPELAWPVEVVLLDAQPVEMSPLLPVASEPPTEAAGQMPGPPSMLASWPMVASSVWLAGSLLCLVLSISRIGRFTRLLRHASVASPDLYRQVETLARQLGLSRCPSVWLVPGVVSPMLWTWGAPRLLIPSDLWKQLPDDERATLLAHELAHLTRRDHWVRYVELAATVLYWWHPVLWWTRRRLRDAEEQCCDAWVLWALPNSARAYAQALVETIDFLSGARRVLPPVASAAGQFPLLKRRLTMILQETTPRRLSAAGVVGMVGLALLLLPLLPTWAQSEPPKDERGEKADREKLEQNKKEIDELTRELGRLHGELEKIHKRLSELGAGDRKLMLFRHPVPPGVPLPPPGAGPQRAPLPPGQPGGPAGGGFLVRTPAPQELEILKAQLDVKKAQVRESEILLQGAKEKLNPRGNDAEQREAQQNLHLRMAQLERAKAEQREVEARLAGAQSHAGPFPAERELKHRQPVPPPQGNERVHELERRLDLLMRELENIRRELKGPEPKR